MPRWLAALVVSLSLAPAAPAADLRDFVEYWSAARVHAAGGNPYDGAQLLPLQRDALGEPGRTEAVMLWTPPWTLSVSSTPTPRTNSGSPRKSA
jgi:hypothetical protein